MQPKVMPTHWTYFSYPADSDLAQGDILSPNEELRALLREVHPHFLDPKYTAFVTITQSCDMVRRSTTCSTRYLNIAVVRQLDDVLDELLKQVCKPVATGVYLHESKREANLLLGRIFNQNERALGLFYLHPDVDAGVAVPSVALLRVSVTLRADHYDVLTRARCGRIGPEFTGKLGWLVGNLYSRIGTPDWSEPREREKQLKKMIEETLDADNNELGPHWVKEATFQHAVENGVKPSSLALPDLLAELEKHKPLAATQQAAEHVNRIVKEVLSDVTTEQLKMIYNRLQNDALFAQVIKNAKGCSE